MIFEAHITCTLVDLEYLQGGITEHSSWKLSKIQGDPLLGPDTHVYLTSHGTDFKEVLERTNRVYASLRDVGVKVLRQKVEMIVFDVRTPQEVE